MRKRPASRQHLRGRELLGPLRLRATAAQQPGTLQLRHQLIQLLDRDLELGQQGRQVGRAALEFLAIAGVRWVATATSSRIFLRVARF